MSYPGDLFVSKLRSPMFTIFEPWLAGWLAGLTVEAVDVGRGAADLQLIHCSLLGDDLTRWGPQSGLALLSVSLSLSVSPAPAQFSRVMSESDNQLTGYSLSSIVQALGETLVNILRTILLWLLDDHLTLKSKLTGEFSKLYQRGKEGILLL